MDRKKPDSLRFDLLHLRGEGEYQTAFDEGYWLGYAQLEVAANPYPEKTPEHLAWDIGYGEGWLDS